MRTTIILDDILLRQARRKAAERGTTLSAVVNEALRESFRSPRAGAPDRRHAFSMVTFGSPQRPVRHEPSDFVEVMEVEDQENLDR